jgi:hypothetical protein
MRVGRRPTRAKGTEMLQRLKRLWSDRATARDERRIDKAERRSDGEYADAERRRSEVDAEAWRHSGTTHGNFGGGGVGGGGG